MAQTVRPTSRDVLQVLASTAEHVPIRSIASIAPVCQVTQAAAVKSTSTNAHPVLASMELASTPSTSSLAPVLQDTPDLCAKQTSTNVPLLLARMALPATT